MQGQEFARAVAAATSIASSLGLAADETVVLQNANKLTVRLLPGDLLARVAPVSSGVAAFEVELARRLAAAGGPVAVPDPRFGPRVYPLDGFEITWWTYYEPTGDVPPAGFAVALARLHAAMRQVDLPIPHFTDRVRSAQDLVADPGLTPELGDADRRFLASTLRDLRQRIVERGRPEQMLHGETHPGNLLATRDGPLFIDLETCCRGPVEFDVAHAPEEVAAHYPGLDGELLRDCRLLGQAVAATWRWDRADDFPDGRRLGREWLAEIRERLHAR